MKTKRFLAMTMAMVLALSLLATMTVAAQDPLERHRAIFLEYLELEVAEHLENHGFDFMALLEEAGFTTDDLFLMIVSNFSVEYLDMVEDILGAEYGHFLAEDVSYAHMIYLFFEGSDEFKAFIFNHWRTEWVVIETYRIMGEHQGDTFLGNDIFWYMYNIFEGPVLIDAMFNDRQYGYLLEELYAEGLLELLADFDLLAELETFFSTDVWHPGLELTDRIFSGLLSENLDFVEEHLEELLQWRQWMADWADSLADSITISVDDPWLQDQVDWMSYDESWIPQGADWEMIMYLRNFIPDFSAYFIMPEEIERRFSRNVRDFASFDIALEDVRGRLNIFFENSNNFDVRFVFLYFYTDEWGVLGTSINWHDVAAGERFTTQLNFDENGGRGDVEIYIYGFGNDIVDGEFAFRWTTHPLGHPTHGPTAAH